MPKPIHYVLDERDFDLSLIPAPARELGSEAFRREVAGYLRKQYEPLGGQTTVEFADGAISVTWTPADADREPMEAIIDLLRAGDYDQARPILETLLQASPRDHDVLYNLGMVYSDEGRLEEARGLLRRATEASPQHTNSWVALGVAALRANALDEARPALERAIELDPENPFALRTLGTLHARTGEEGRAVELLRRAVAVAPEDPIGLLSLAQTLIQQDVAANAAEADGLLLQVLQIAPHGDLATRAKDARRAIASHSFRSHAVEGLRPDAVMYCLGAMERFEGMDARQVAPVVMEIATLGQSGLPVNDPETRYTLRSLPGEFSALQLVCMLHVGIKKIDPTMGSGFDVDQEYQAAQSMRSGRGRAGA